MARGKLSFQSLHETFSESEARLLTIVVQDGSIKIVSQYIFILGWNSAKIAAEAFLILRTSPLGSENFMIALIVVYRSRSY